MAPGFEFTLTGLPWEPSADEAKYLTELVSDVVRRWQHERDRPSHVCSRSHAGRTIATPDVDEAGHPVIHQASGEPTVTLHHQHEPRCHDCGRELHRPPVGDQTWLCPAALVILPPGKSDSAVECGEKART